jgi:hypothetical protein
MRLTLKVLKQLARSKGLVVEKTNGSLYKYEVYKPEPLFDGFNGFVTKPATGSIFARNAGETQYEIENWGQS